MSTMLKSVQYAFARQVIAFLSADEKMQKQGVSTVQRQDDEGKTYEVKVAAAVEQEPYDSSDQLHQLRSSAIQHREVAILVCPAGVEAPLANERGINSGVVPVLCHVLILTTKQVKRGQGSARERAAAWADYVLMRLTRWQQPDSRQIYPRVSAVEELELTKDFPNHENLLGAAITVSRNVHYPTFCQ